MFPWEKELSGSCYPLLPKAPEGFTIKKSIGKLSPEYRSSSQKLSSNGLSGLHIIICIRLVPS